MLCYLAIRDLAIIDELKVEFRSGFCVLTGETGAGKSILIQSLQLVLGGRASPDLIRSEAENAEVEAEFRLVLDAPVYRRLAELDMTDGDTLLVRRILSRNGRSRAFVNGHAISATRLAALVKGLVDITGQHEHVGLTDEESHRDILDEFGSLVPRRKEVAELVAALRKLERELMALSEQERQRAQREDYLRFSLDRIEAFGPEAGEDVSLQKERTRLKNRQQLGAGLQEAVALLYQNDGSVVEQLGRASSVLAKLNALDESFSDSHAASETVLRQIEDLARDLEREIDGLDAEPDRLQQVDDRWNELRALLRIHGPELDDMLQNRETMVAELAALVDSASRKSALGEEVAQARALALERASGLSRARQKVAKDLAGKLIGQLKSLAMEAAKVEIQVQRGTEKDLDASGLDRVRFLLSANPGQEVRPLSRVASGGELSRVLLALKAVLRKVDPVPCYVFDEVDSGVGGRVAGMLGEKLAQVSQQHQVLCITHLPQIAAWADNHYVVRKEISGGQTKTSVSFLQPEQRQEEVARMAGGAEVTHKARVHAGEMLHHARQKSKTLRRSGSR